MCRLYISKGSIDLSNALKLAAKYDPYMPSDRKQHGDGWGFVAMSQREFFYYKSGLPAWEDPTVVPMREAVLAHARAASPGEPVGPAHSHPYMAHLDDGRIIFVAHNGSVDKKALAAELGIDPTGYTDSFVLTLFLAKNWGNPDKAVENAMRYVKTALNLAVLEFPSLRAYAYTYYRGPREYYAMYLIKKGGAVAVVSSTLLRHIEYSGEELKSGTLLAF